MKVYKYKAKSHIQLLDTLFIKDDIFYATDCFYVMDGHFDYAHKIFDADKKYLGMINRDKFPENQIEQLNA